MRAHWLQHVPHEGLGHLQSWLDRAGAEVTCTRLFAGDPLPDPREPDLLIVLGGPMSVNDDDSLPWLAAERRFIRDMIDQDRAAVLGICLGGQLIARALGARVGPSPEREVGWWPVEAVPPAGGAPDPARFPFPGRVAVLHWHGEAFDLPAGAVWLARSEGCPHQAMQFGRRVIGLQFHPEATPGWAQAVLAASPGALRPGPYVMAENELMADLAERCRAGNQLADDIMDFIMSPY